MPHNISMATRMHAHPTRLLPRMKIKVAGEQQLLQLETALLVK